MLCTEWWHSFINQRLNHPVLYKCNCTRIMSLNTHNKNVDIIQGSPHLQKIGRLDFSLREHEGEVKASEGDFQQLHRDMIPQKHIVGVFLHHFLKYLHLKCDFANILLISFIFKSPKQFLFLLFSFLSHFWDRPVPIFSDVRFSYPALVQDKKITCVLTANACCTVSVNYPPIIHAFPF